MNADAWFALAGGLFAVLALVAIKGSTARWEEAVRRRTQRIVSQFRGQDDVGRSERDGKGVGEDAGQGKGVGVGVGVPQGKRDGSDQGSAT